MFFMFLLVSETFDYVLSNSNEIFREKKWDNQGWIKVKQNTFKVGLNDYIIYPEPLFF